MQNLNYGYGFIGLLRLLNCFRVGTWCSEVFIELTHLPQRQAKCWTERLDLLVWAKKVLMALNLIALCYHG